MATRHRIAAAAAVVALVLAPSAPAAVTVEVEQIDGTVTSGALGRIDTAEVRLSTGATLPLEKVRAVRRTDAAPDGPRPLAATLVDGSRLSVDDCSWDGKGPLVLVRPEGRIEVPIGRVKRLSWSGDTDDRGAAPAWQAAIPEGVESDLVVVGTAESHEFVECAITAVSADAVTVLLDEETIPVKRPKVQGLEWLRPDAQAAATAAAAVRVAGGELRAGRVEWSSEGLVLDGEIRLPAAALVAVDFAAARTIALAGVAPEKLDVEPWFGDLGRQPGLAPFFAPRATATGLVIRPRTIATWRLPPDARRFRARVAPASAAAGEAAVVAVSIDGREVFRRPVDGGSTPEADASAAPAGIPIDVDVTTGRRLTLSVDFAPGGGMGGAVRFGSPVIER
ncbi:MAG: hypothetical protein RLZZ111_419 [Planctomycetota bacterium]|jgi:hypothetical protein